MKRRSADIILKIIHKYNKTVTLMNLAQEFHVSTKTLKNDVKEINQFLKLNELSPIELSEEGVFTIDRDFDIPRVMESLYEMDVYDYKLSPLERQIYIQIALIFADGYLTMKAFADELFVTRITIISDTDAIKEYLKNFHTVLVLDSGKGMLLKGNYEDKLELLIALYKQIAGDVMGEGIFQRMIVKKMRMQHSFSEIFMDMQEYVQLNNLVFVETVFYDIVLYLFIIFNYPIPTMKSDLPVSREHSLSEIDHMLLYAGQRLNMKVTQEMLQRFQSYIREHHLYSFVKTVDEVELYKVITHFISEIETSFHMTLLHDNVLLDSLLLHIKSMRDWGDYEIELPVKEDQAIDYQLLQELVDQNAYILEHFLGYTLSDNMKKSIIIHICVAVIRNRKYSDRLSAAIVCPGSMATGRYLEAQIRNYFDFDIIGVYTVYEVKRILAKQEKHVDFILSTVNIQIEGYQVLQVKPFLSMEDLNYIQSETFQKQKTNNLTLDNQKMKIKDYICGVIEDESLKRELCESIDSILHTYEKLTIEPKKSPIAELLRKDFIMLQEDAIGWEAAMRRVAEPLIAHGFIEQRYIEESIFHVKEYGDYLVVSPGVALAHTSKDNGVLKDGLSLIVSRHGIQFPQDTIVHLLFCFSSRGDRDYLELLRAIIGLGKTEGTVSSICNLSQIQEVYHRLLYA